MKINNYQIIDTEAVLWLENYIKIYSTYSTAITIKIMDFFSEMKLTCIGRKITGKILLEKQPQHRDTIYTKLQCSETKQS